MWADYDDSNEETSEQYEELKEAFDDLDLTDFRQGKAVGEFCSLVGKSMTMGSWTGRNTYIGFFYVGCTTDVNRRLRQHNGEIKGGGKYTSKHRPWKLMCTYGTYANRSEAMKAEMALKRKRGRQRLHWTLEDSKWCRGKNLINP